MMRSRRIAVVYYSPTGHLHRLAEAFAAGDGGHP